MKLFQNAEVFAPESIGRADVLVVAGQVVALQPRSEGPLEIQGIPDLEVIDASDRRLTPGFIDQHIHITGAGGKYGYGSMTPEVHVTDLVRCGTTTVVGLLGTDGTARSLN